MTEDLAILSDWFNANKLSLNVSKSNYMFFTRSCQTTADIQLHIMNQTISRTRTFKLLGVYLDDKFTWNEHIRLCHSKLSSALYIINKVRGVVPISSLKSIYFALAYPHLIYGITLWGSASDAQKKHLFVMQKKLIRSMSKADYLAHTHELFVQLGILKLEDIYYMETAKFMYKYVCMDLPVSLSNIFQNTCMVHSHATRQASHIRGYHPRTNLSSKSVLCQGPAIWNALHVDIQNKSSLRSFSYHLRQNILGRYRKAV